ncbi:hypothetical protein [Brucella endophytica]|uniref:hypothetical protein n=1 Tax=Brucella endophytica TaxID=1963359 RepID=UPI001664EB18|nr:hypothetical protein [Brucella endophytica]
MRQAAASLQQPRRENWRIAAATDKFAPECGNALRFQQERPRSHRLEFNRAEQAVRGRQPFAISALAGVRGVARFGWLTSGIAPNRRTRIFL